MTHLTFQPPQRAADAVEFYVGLVPGSEVIERVSIAPGQETLEFTLAGQRFFAADSPVAHAWTFSPAMSVFLLCSTPDEVDDLFAALSDGGHIFMPMGDYGFNPHFGWCADRFGVAWQIGVDTAGAAAGSTI